MSISMIAKSLAKELMSTKEYQNMVKKKELLYVHPHLSAQVKEYELKQISILNLNATPAKKQTMITALSKEYQSLLSTKEMKEYIDSIRTFQNKTFVIFQSLNVEINKIVK